MAYPRFRRARTHQFLEVASGAILVNSTTWAELAVEDGQATGAWDLAVPAQIGDVIEVGAGCAYGNEAVEVFLDMATVVAGSPVNYVGCDGASGSYGVRAWTGLASVYGKASGSAWRTLVSGDIEDGLVTARAMVRTSAAVNKTVGAAVTGRLQLSLKNLGPAAP